MNKVLEKKIRRALHDTIGSFVDLKEDSLNLALASGKAILGPGLALRPDAFARLGLPVVLVSGYVESIDITIPTLHLKTKPIIVAVKKVLVTVSPNPNTNTKRAVLIAHDRKWEQAGDDDEGTDPDSKIGKILQKLVDNMHIVLEDVHVRLEDSRTSQQKYAMGFVMDRFEMGSCVVQNGVWRETCVKQIQRYLNKVFEVGAKNGPHGSTGLGMYCEWASAAAAI